MSVSYTTIIITQRVNDKLVDTLRQANDLVYISRGSFPIVIVIGNTF
ncbi:hypothetical protein BH18THE2_BH18THE2_05160 [soil metagenome]